MDDEHEQTAIVGALAAYLRANPFASDTADGIARWWLAAHGDPGPDRVTRALETMKGLGLIEETIAGDGRRRYRRRASDEQLAAVLERIARHGRFAA